MPHFSRALEIGWRVGTDDLAGLASLEFLDLLADSVVLLSGSGAVLVANRIARVLTSERLPRLTTDGLHLGDRRADARLRRLVAGATATAQGRAMAGGGFLRLGGPPGRIVSVVPLIGSARGSTLQDASVAVFIRDLRPACGPEPAKPVGSLRAHTRGSQARRRAGRRGDTCPGRHLTSNLAAHRARNSRRYLPRRMSTGSRISSGCWPGRRHRPWSSADGSAERRCRRPRAGASQ